MGRGEHDARPIRRLGRISNVRAIMYLTRRYGRVDSLADPSIAISSTAPGRINCGLGLIRSADGMQNWSAVPPPSYEWGPLGRGTSMEIGGVEKIGGRYYAIGGSGNGGYDSYPVEPGRSGDVGGQYSMWTLSADSIEGPFAPKPDSFRLSGSTQGPSNRETLHGLGAWVHDCECTHSGTATRRCCAWRCFFSNPGRCCRRR